MEYTWRVFDQLPEGFLFAPDKTWETTSMGWVKPLWTSGEVLQIWAGYCIDWGVRTGVCELLLPLKVAGAPLYVAESLQRGHVNLWEIGGRKRNDLEGGRVLTDVEVVDRVMERYVEYCGVVDDILDGLNRVLVSADGEVLDGERLDVTIVEERYVHSLKPGVMGGDVWSSGRLGAMAEGWRKARGMDDVGVTSVLPGDAKTFASNERLRHWGIWNETVGMKHGRDALRCGVVAMVKVPRAA